MESLGDLNLTSKTSGAPPFGGRDEHPTINPIIKMGINRIADIIRGENVLCGENIFRLRIFVMLVVFVMFCVLFLIMGYVLYGGFLSRVFQVGDNPTPAERLYDGRDYVPARSWLVLFGHHFASIAGAGPIVGPTLALIYWGWLPAFLWVLFGSVFMGGVHDFGSMMVSLRNDGKSISEVSRIYVSEYARVLFSAFVWFALVLIVAVFAHFAAKSYVGDPHIVIPSLGLIPVALIYGFLTYKLNINLLISTILGILGLIILIPLGEMFPIKASYHFWLLILLIYSFMASVIPVQYLLQPRDYISSYLLVGGILVMFAGALISGKHFNIPPVKSSDIPLVPFLFVTVACGAISGFHSLISSGTSAKQLPKERDSKKISYGAMLLEGFLAVLVIAAVGSLSGGLDPSNPIGTFGKGVGNITPFLGSYGGYFAILVLNAFILTTLDTATRIARYITTEFFGLKNIYISSAIVVICSLALLLGGQADNLWTVFGAANQLLAALSLFVITAWLFKTKRNYIVSLIPAIFMSIITLWALVYQFGKLNMVALIFAIALFILGVFVSLSSLMAIFKRA